jgi:hypothetical protein
MQMTDMAMDDDQDQLDHEAQEKTTAEKMARLNAFGMALAAKRKEDVDHRSQSGIEDEWEEDEDHYEGVDDANRAERKLSKPTGTNGGSSNYRTPPKSGTRSTAFVPITMPFVDFAASRAADVLLPTDDRGFVVEHTPMPDIESAVGDETVAFGDGMTIGGAAKMMVEEAKAGAEMAQRRIDDWLAECGYNTEARKVLHDAAKIGTGVMKGPFAAKSKSTTTKKDRTGLVEVVIDEKIAPKSKRISAWDVFPDKCCGDNIHNGSRIWERDRMTGRQLRELIGVPGYLEDQIELALKEGPGKRYQDNRDSQPDADQFEVWYFHGFAEKEDLEAADCECEEGESFPVMVTMVNDLVIRAVMSPLDSGKFPYDVMVWSRRVGSPWGIGVSRQMRTPQRMVNAATRAMLDNAGRSSAPQLVIDRSLVVPADNTWEIVPGKLWYTTEDGANADVRKAFVSIDIPSNQQQLQNIINFALELSERVTGIPLLAQGQQGAATQTVGGMTLLDRNSNTPLRMIAKNFDDMITVPHIQRYYEWLLLYGDDPREKLNSRIIARGSSVLFERDAQNQALLQMGQFVLNPAFGINPKKWMSEALRAQRLDPARLEYTDEEIQQMQQAAAEAGQQGDPRAAVQKEIATIRADGEMKKATLNQESDMAELQFKAEQAELQRQHDFAMRQMELQQDMMQFAREQNMTLEQIKAELFQTTAKLKTQEKLSMMSVGAKQAATPPTEPAGRAEDGRAYEQ